MNPAFLLSLPRSGSTLLQRMLGTHSEISTVPEPWILIPYVYALRQRGVYAEYGHATASKAIREFCNALPGGRRAYDDAVSGLARRLYTLAGDPTVKYFLDKTPRYSLIAEELLDIFPEEKFIVLWRNPLAILSSLLETFVDGRWMPYLFKVDLFTCFESLLSAFVSHRDRFIVVRYEDVVRRPAEEMRRLLAHLELEWEPAVVDDFASLTLAGRVGDPTGVRRYQRVSDGSLERWKQVLGTPVRKRWCARYLEWIGSQRMAVMGYDLGQLRDELDAIPETWRGMPSDVLLMAKGAASVLLEPSIIRSKLSAGDWRRVHGHT